MSSNFRADTVAELISKCLALRLEGIDDIPFEEVCLEYPELLDEVRRGVDRADRLPSLQSAGPGRDKMVGSIFAGRYSVDERLGTGAMGVVYAATDLDLGREVAIKLVHAGFLAQDQILARFEREAAALAAVKHDSVVTIYDRGVTEGDEPFIVMERIDGVQCSEILDQAANRLGQDDTDWLGETFGITGIVEPSFLRQSIRWAADLAGGLEAAHAAGVFHRDVKPSNVMIRRDGRAVLLDFGIAAKDDQITLTRTDAAVGTPAYMAPEVLKGRTPAMPTQDIYGLSATLYHFLTLRPPYEGSSSEAIAALATREPIRARKLRPGLPADAQAILEHGMARRPSTRYASAAAIERDLRQLLAYQPVSVSRTSTLTRIVRRVSRSKLAIGAAAAALVLGSLVAWRDMRIENAKTAEATFRARWLEVPANIGYVTAANRRLASEEAQAAVLDTLDALVEAGHQHVSALLIRGTFLWDQGNHEAALDDFQAIAGRTGSAYAMALAKRYEAAGSSGTLDALDSLPAPESETDYYLAAYETIRSAGFEAAREYLDPTLCVSNRHIEEIRFQQQLIDTPVITGDGRSPEKTEATLGFIRDLEEFELSTGFVGALTGHLKSFGYLQLEEPGRALAAAVGVLAASPFSAPTLQNAAEACIQLRALEESKRYSERALELNPTYWRVRMILAKACAYLGEPDLAQNVVAGTDFPAGKSGVTERENLLASINTIAAIQLRASDRDRAAEFARSALDHSSRLSESSPLRARATSYAQAALHGDDRTLFQLVLSELPQEPLAMRLIDDVAGFWPDQLSDEESQLLKAWINELNTLLELQSRTTVAEVLDRPDPKLNHQTTEPLERVVAPR